MNLISPLRLLPTIIIFLAFVTTSNQYKELSVESDELCSPVKSRKIKLGKGPKSGLIVTTSRLGDHSMPWKANFFCNFRIEPSSTKFHIPFLQVKESNGIFAVIQRIVFRRNETTDECIDYVQFSRNDGSRSQKFCGIQNAALSMDHLFVPLVEGDTVAVGNSFDSLGDLEVTIFVSRESLRYDEEMDLEIVFTAYKDCRIEYKDDMQPCTELIPNKCIYNGFFHDNFINCPYTDCLDEGGCSSNQDLPSDRQSFGNKVLIGSISSLFIVFAVFVCCLWMCRKHGILCWSESFAHPSSTPTNPNSSRVIEMNEPIRARTVPPSLSTQATAPEEDKDLPPSYDSLFPSR